MNTPQSDVQASSQSRDAAKQKGPETVRVGLHIVHVPCVRLEPCLCGSVQESPHPAMVAAARNGIELPPVECTCGRVLIGQRRLVVA